MDEKLKLNVVEFLKSLTRVIVQSNLYSEDHPQVKKSASEFISYFRLLCEILEADKIKLSFVQNKLMINGIVILSNERVPFYLINLYKKLNIDSIEFQKNVTETEVISFSKISSIKDIDPIKYLQTKNISNIVIAKEKYIKAGSQNINNFSETDLSLEGKNFVESIREIVSRLSVDEVKQKKIVENLLKKFKDEVESAIEKAINEIKKEKIKIENDYSRVESVISTIAGSEIIIDKDGNIIMSTPNSELVTGKELKEMSGKKLSEFLLGENKVINIAQDISEVSTKKIDTTVKIHGNNDLLKTMKNSTAVIKNEEGKIVGTITVPHDIIKLKEIDQMKSDFISMITHELKSPLTSIKMALDLVSREENLDTSSKSMINAAIRNAERLNSIINDILDFSKLQSGKMVFNLQEVSPYEVIGDAIAAMKAWALSKNISLYSKCDNGLPDIYVDKRKTEQILINLISNAIKFTPEKGIIEVGANTEGQFVKFYVKDNGCGIKKEDLGKIFEKFVQVASGEKIGGTGLGLAITKAMVIMQGGSIDVESEYGRGSTFYFKLPVYRKEKDSKDIERINVKIPWWKRFFKI
ncbi:MAG: HAMP domain-containing histidine kinase [Elusimicrobiales bacterium]|nr:HAMP domain-containing histidine kinase [Elusimicrobiales bacterium]